MVNIGILVQDMAKVSFHFVRGGQTEKFATTLVNFMGKVSLFLLFISPFFLFPVGYMCRKPEGNHSKMES